METLLLTVSPLWTYDPVCMETASQASIREAFGLVVRFTLRPGQEEPFDELVAQTVAQIARHEPGTLLYLSHAVDGEPQTRVFYELYRDHDAFVAHEQQPHVRHFLAERAHHVERVTVDRLSPAAYAGIGDAPT